MISTPAFAPPPPALHPGLRRSIPIGGEVRCIDGSAGRIAGAVRNADGVLIHVVVRRPGAFTRHTLVPARYAGDIGDDVALELRCADLDRFPEHRADDEIIVDVEQALRSMELFHDRDDFVAVRVVVANGVVELRGYVRSEARRAETTAIAGRIRGVLEVRNHLYSDQAIERTLGEVFSADRRLAGKQIRSACRFGVVDLFGEVATRAERAVATVVARQVPGVVAINTLLRVAA